MFENNNMEKLIEKYIKKLDQTPLSHFRYLLGEVDWSNRFIGIKGARGSGKTTLMLQHILTSELPQDQTLYVSLDDLYFTENKLVDLVDLFVKEGGKHLLVDEVHRYPNWSIELKNIYDDHPKLQIVFTGSSLIHIEQAKGDLSRRAVFYELFGLSFREFLSFSGVVDFKKLTLEDVLADHISASRLICKEIKPLAWFKQYLQYGYYPYFSENKDTYHQKLAETINVALSTDLPGVHKLNYRSIEKIRLLLHVLAESVPFKPNISKLSERIEVSRSQLLAFLKYLEDMRIVWKLYTDSIGISRLQKPEKLYLSHPNLFYALTCANSNIGSIRESFFISQLSTLHQVEYTKIGDFRIGDRTFEIGGRAKSQKQIKNIERAFIAADEIEIGYKNKIPLWLFGFLY